MEQLLRSFKVEYELLAGVSTSQVDVERSRRLNTRIEMLHPETVAKYVAALERGDKFPPIVAFRGSGGKAKKLTVADGNHRVAAHEELGLPLDVYLIDPATPASTVVMIAYRCNELNGRPYTDKERLSHAIYLVDNDLTQKEAAELMGIPQHRLSTALNLREADDRANEAGLTAKVWEGLHPTVRARLNSIQTNDVMVKAAILARDATLTTTHVTSLVAKLAKDREPARQLRTLEDERKLYRERIASTVGGKKSPRGPQSNKHIWSLVMANARRASQNPTLVAGQYKGDEREPAAEEFETLGQLCLRIAKELQS